MLLQDFLPSAVLQEYVKSFGIVHLVFSPTELIPPKVFIPKPQESLDFYLRDPEQVTYPETGAHEKRASAMVVGQHTEVTQRSVGREFLYLQIRFQPGALYRLAGIPAHELVNTAIEGQIVFSADLRRTEERLKNAASYADLLVIAEAFVLQQVRRCRKVRQHIDVVANALLQRPEQVSLRALADASCLCMKQFERKFYERMGVRPSLFARLIRFERAFRFKNNSPGLDWLSIALQCGYSDYQHLVRDYKAFTGLTPPAFFQVDKCAPERLFGLSET